MKSRNVTSPQTPTAYLVILGFFSLSALATAIVELFNHQSGILHWLAVLGYISAATSLARVVIAELEVRRKNKARAN